MQKKYNKFKKLKIKITRGKNNRRRKRKGKEESKLHRTAKAQHRGRGLYQ